LVGAGSNQSVSGSWALATASSCVSPAVAQPGNSGNSADLAFGFWIKFYQQPEFHYPDDNRGAASNQADRQGQ
jgi:hypothetical protein